MLLVHTSLLTAKPIDTATNGNLSEMGEKFVPLDAVCWNALLLLFKGSTALLFITTVHDYNAHLFKQHYDVFQTSAFEAQI